MSDSPKPTVLAGTGVARSPGPAGGRPTAGTAPPSANALARAPGQAVTSGGPASSVAAGQSPKNRGRDWIGRKLEELEYAQTQYVLTAGLILRHHVESRQVGNAPSAVRAPAQLLEHLERTREDYTWIRAEIEQYAGRMRTEPPPPLSPDLPVVALPMAEPTAARSPAAPRPLQPPAMSKTQPLGTGAPSYLKPQGQAAPSPLRHPTTVSPAAAGSEGASPFARPQAMSAPASSANVGGLAGAGSAAGSGPNTSSGTASQTRPSSTSQLPATRPNVPSQLSSPGRLALPTPSSSSPKPALPKQPTPAPPPPPSQALSTTPAAAPEPNAAKPRPKPKPRLNHSLASGATGPTGPGGIGFSAASDAPPIPSPSAAPTQPSTTAAVASAPNGSTTNGSAPPPPATAPLNFRLQMPRPSDFLPGANKSGPSPSQPPPPPPPPAQQPTSALQQAPLPPPQQQQLMNAATGQHLTAADVEGMSSEEAQRIIDSFQQQQQQQQQPTLNAPAFNVGGSADVPLVGAADLAFDPAMLGDLDLSMMGDLFDPQAAGADGLGADIDWDEVMKGLAQAPAEGQ